MAGYRRGAASGHGWPDCMRPLAFQIFDARLLIANSANVRKPCALVSTQTLIRQTLGVLRLLLMMTRDSCL